MTVTDIAPLPALAVGRIGDPGRERPVVVFDGVAYDARPVTDDIDPGFFDRGGLEALVAAARAGVLPATTVDGERFGAPVGEPRKIVGIGLNYHDHARETGATPPAEPVVFLKDPGCVVGPDDDVHIPPGSTKTDWEVELAVVVGSTASYLSGPEVALDHVAGYTIANDVSERELQIERSGGQWDKGKSCPTFLPLGPWLVPVEAVPDPQVLGLRLWLNGEARQDATTAEMVFPVAELVWAVSQCMVLRAGDVIITGTPAGVGLGSADQRFLRPGDVVELAIDGLGRQRQQLVATDMPS